MSVNHAQRCLALASLVLLIPLAGCTEPAPSPDGDGTDEVTTWHIQGTQCEAYPWGDQYGGEAEEPGLEDRIESHYGIDLTSADTVSDGQAYIAQCGQAGDQHVQVNVTGDASSLEEDGWSEGAVTRAA